MPKRTFKKWKHQGGDTLVSLFLTLLALILRRLPPEAMISIAKILGKTAYLFQKKYRKRVIQNLSNAFGTEKESGEIAKLAREVFFHSALIPLETVYVYSNPLERFLLKIDIKGRENLDVALARGKGVIALGAHLGPFTLVGTRLTMEGYSFNLIINEGSFPKMWKKLNGFQQRLGQNTIPLKPVTSSLKKSLNCLRRNEILYLIADEQQRRGGVPVPFFGQTAYTASGPAILSLKTGAPILPMFILREEGIRRELVIGQPIEIERTFDMEKDIRRLTAKFTLAIEKVVRQHPSQWSWLNRRWKLPPLSSAPPLPSPNPLLAERDSGRRGFAQTGPDERGS